MHPSRLPAGSALNHFCRLVENTLQAIRRKKRCSGTARPNSTRSTGSVSCPASSDVRQPPGSMQRPTNGWAAQPPEVQAPLPPSLSPANHHHRRQLSAILEEEHSALSDGQPLPQRLCGPAPSYGASTQVGGERAKPLLPPMLPCHPAKRSLRDTHTDTSLPAFLGCSDSTQPPLSCQMKTAAQTVAGLGVPARPASRHNIAGLEAVRPARRPHTAGWEVASPASTCRSRNGACR